jgi:hypothetical protein
MTVTERTIERDWRARRAQYLIETGRAESMSGERWLANCGPDHPEREKRAREVVRRVEMKIFGLQFDSETQTSAWDSARETEVRKQIGRESMQKRWGRV